MLSPEESARMSPPTGFLEGLVDPRLVFPDLVSKTREEVLGEMARRLAEAAALGDPGELAERLRRRERDGCTGLGGGVAIPHCRWKNLRNVVMAVGVCPSGIDFGAPDGIPVSLFFLVLSPMETPALHLQVLARLSRLIRAPGFAAELRRARSAEEIASLLRGAESPASAATA